MELRIRYEIRCLTKQFRKGVETITPLDQIDLDDERGKSVPLIGESGSGKNPFWNAVADIDRPTSGEIVANGT